MTTLMNKTSNKIIAPDLQIARSFFARGKGLLGRKSLPENEALWIHRCNSIHTCFMKFPIDCIFVDKEMKVKSIHRNILPWRLVMPVWGANSVIEMAAGTADKLSLALGDQLYVGT